MHLRDATDAFLLQLQADGRAASTVDQYRRYLRVLGDWLAGAGLPLRVEAIDHGMLARFLTSPAARCRPDGRAKQASAMNVMRSKCRTFFAYCEAAGYVERSPARLVRRAKCGPPPPRTLGEADCERLLAELKARSATRAGARDLMLAELLLGAGLRLGSAVALRVEDVDLDGGTLRLAHAKGDRDETAVLPGRTARALRAYLGGRTRGWVFEGAPGRAVGTRQARRRIEAACAAAGLPRGATPHTLRHTFATRLYRRTGDLGLVQRALGHRSIASTTVYARVDEGALRKALAG